MNGDGSRPRSGVRYQPDESPPMALAFALGLQLAVLTIAGIVLTPVIVIRAAGGDEMFLSWAVFAAVAVSGVTTVLQAVRVGRVGAGYVLMMGTSGAFIAVCVTAIAEGGPAMLATLVVISSLFQFALSARLSLLRRILTPTVAGTVIMLIAVTVMPIVFDMLTQVPAGTPPSAAPVCVLATALVIVGIALKAGGRFASGRRSSGSSPARWSPRSTGSTTWTASPMQRGSGFPKAGGPASTLASGRSSGGSFPPSCS